MNKVYKIVLTGGPCAGKTTALSKVTDKFLSLGFAVIVVPESASLFHFAGINFNEVGKKLYNIEASLFSFQTELEKTFTELANHLEEPTIVIFDRGIMDIGAYLSTEMWQALIDQKGTNLVELRDKRYDGVIHLVTAAKGAEKFYTLSNNLARKESIEEAAVLDDKLIKVWTGHPHFRIVPNKGSFEDKMNTVLSEVSTIIGVPAPIETERKFLVKINEALPNFVEVEIFQTYLVSNDNIESRVRKRGQNGNYIYFYTEKQTVSDDSRIETEKQISPSEYLEYLERADKSKMTIHKKRKCFIWDNLYYELDDFLVPTLENHLLEIEGNISNQEIKFPPFIEVLKEVTNDKNYYNSNIANI